VVTLAEAVTTLATAARKAGVTHLRLRRGPVSELVLLPDDPPPVDTGKEKDPQELAAEAQARRDSTLWGAR
jgi:hypothetical protein